MAKSWFYLTLWRGTPPEFTDDLGADIAEAEKVAVGIQRTDNLASEISTALSAVSNVISRSDIGTNVTTTTEVIWYVG